MSYESFEVPGSPMCEAKHRLDSNAVLVILKVCNRNLRHGH